MHYRRASARARFMIYGPLLLLSVALFELFVLLKMAESARTILASSREAMRILASPDLGDDEKESCMRRGSLEILKATLGLAGKLLLMGAILFALFELIVAIFPALRQPLPESLVSPTVIVILTVAVIGYAWLRKLALRRRH
jgi:hypothetical protein